MPKTSEWAVVFTNSFLNRFHVNWVIRWCFEQEEQGHFAFQENQVQAALEMGKKAHAQDEAQEKIPKEEG